MSFSGQPVIEAVGETWTGLGGCGVQQPGLERAMLANGCIKIDDVAPQPAPSLVADLVAAPVNTFKIGR